MYTSGFGTISQHEICVIFDARDDGHHYDVTSKCCGVTITTRLIEWTLSISEMNVFFYSFQKLSSLKKYKLSVG